MESDYDRMYYREELAELRAKVGEQKIELEGLYRENHLLTNSVNESENTLKRFDTLEWIPFSEYRDEKRKVDKAIEDINKLMDADGMTVDKRKLDDVLFDLEGGKVTLGLSNGT